MDTSLEIISKVDQLYTNALTHILVFTGFMVILTGVITPFFVSIYSKRLHKLDEAESRQKIEDETKAALSELRVEFDRYCKEADIRLAAGADRAFAATQHMQGNQQFVDKKYGASAVSYLEASAQYLRAGDYYNLLRVLRSLEVDVIPKLTRLDFSGDRLEERFVALTKRLETQNTNNMFREWIDNFHVAVPAALIREPISNETAAA
jgi:hypothetical protein